MKMLEKQPKLLSNEKLCKQKNQDKTTFRCSRTLAIIIATYFSNKIVICHYPFLEFELLFEMQILCKLYQNLPDSYFILISYQTFEYPTTELQRLVLLWFWHTIRESGWNVKPHDFGEIALKEYVDNMLTFLQYIFCTVFILY